MAEVHKVWVVPTKSDAPPVLVLSLSLDTVNGKRIVEGVLFRKHLILPQCICLCVLDVAVDTEYLLY